MRQIEREIMTEMGEHAAHVQPRYPPPDVPSTSDGRFPAGGKQKDPASMFGQSRRADHDITRRLQCCRRERRPLRRRGLTKNRPAQSAAARTY